MEVPYATRLNGGGGFIPFEQQADRSKASLRRECPADVHRLRRGSHGGIQNLPRTRHAVDNQERRCR